MRSGVPELLWQDAGPRQSVPEMVPPLYARWGPLLLHLLLCLHGPSNAQAAKLTEVRTAREMQRAVAAGAAHIVVVEHLDLRNLAAQGEIVGRMRTPALTKESYVFNLQDGTSSITGRCQHASSLRLEAGHWGSTPKAELRAGQCLLVFSQYSAFLADTQVERPVWLDSLYVLMSPPKMTAQLTRCGVYATDDVASLYLTNVTFESMTSVVARNDALHLSSGKVAAEGLEVLNFDQLATEPCTFNTTVSLIESRFAGNVVKVGSFAAGAIAVYGNIKLEEVVFSENRGTGLAAAYDIFAWEKGAVYSDLTSVTSYFYPSFLFPWPSADSPTHRMPEPLQVAPRTFASFADADFVALRDQVQTALLQAGLELPSQSEADPFAILPEQAPSSTDQTRVVVGGAVGALAVLISVAIAYCVCCKRRDQNAAPLREKGALETSGLHSKATAAVNEREQTEATAGTSYGAPAPRTPEPEWVTMTEFQTRHLTHVTDAGAPASRKCISQRGPSDPQATAASSEPQSTPTRNPFNATQSSMEADWVTMPAYDPLEASHDIALVPLPSRQRPRDGSSTAGSTDPTAGPPTDEAVERDSMSTPCIDPTAPARPQQIIISTEIAELAESARLAGRTLLDALDDMHAQKQLLMDTYTVLDARQRRIGSTSVVQFIVDAVTGEQLAVKFYLDEGSGLRREADLHRKAELRDVMAGIVDLQDNRNGELTAPSGLVLPPFKVSERGRSLHEWILHAKPDYLTSLQMLVQIIERLRALHQHRLAHCNLKPANILWTNAGTWTLVDLGCAAQSGQKTEIACLVPYASPEVAHAIKEQRSVTTAHTSMDIWALGVIIWELLVGERAFPELSDEQIVAALDSPAPLPWEPGGKRSGASSKLGIVKRIIANCLHRDPAERPTAEDLMGSMHSVLRLETTTQTES